MCGGIGEITDSELMPNVAKLEAENARLRGDYRANEIKWMNIATKERSESAKLRGLLKECQEYLNAELICDEPNRAIRIMCKELEKHIGKALGEGK
jgi:hypothetical protein